MSFWELGLVSGEDRSFLGIGGGEGCLDMIFFFRGGEIRRV